MELIKEVPMKLRTFSLVAVFAAFTIYTAFVVFDHGYTGFISLAMAGGWGLQIFVDLVIALTLFLIWMVPDARGRRIPAAPYVILVFAAGSIGALAYLVHRALKEGNTVPSQAQAAVR